MLLSPSSSLLALAFLVGVAVSTSSQNHAGMKRILHPASEVSSPSLKSRGSKGEWTLDEQIFHFEADFALFEDNVKDILAVAKKPFSSTLLDPKHMLSAAFDKATEAIKAVDKKQSEFSYVRPAVPNVVGSKPDGGSGSVLDNTTGSLDRSIIKYTTAYKKLDRQLKEESFGGKLVGDPDIKRAVQAHAAALKHYTFTQSTRINKLTLSGNANKAQTLFQTNTLPFLERFAQRGFVLGGACVGCSPAYKNKNGPNQPL
ncbi:hypothetical protein P7C70_g6276, partial [Phenoliferia sp. Uapishka_3]